MIPEAEPGDVAGDLQRGLWLLAAATVVLYLAVAVAIVLVWRDASSKRQDLARQATNTGAALCTLRGDLEQRVEASQRFLREHPKGIPGINAATIQSGIVNQQRTVDALSGLNCAPPS